MKRGRKRDYKKIEKVKKLHEAGLSYNQISMALYGTTNHKKTIWRWLVKYKVGKLSTAPVVVGK